MRIAALWRNLLRRRDVEADLDEELRETVRLLVDEKVRAGLSPDDAHRTARREFGSLDAVKDRVRDVRAGSLAEAFLFDIRYATRLLRRNPIFALTAVLSLAIGIGANTTIFTIADALLLSAPSGVRDPGRIVDVARTQRGPRGGTFNQSSYPNYLDVRARVTSLDGVYAYLLVPDGLNLSVTGGVERVLGNLVTANYFDVLGVRPALGRLFASADEQGPGIAPIAVLSYRFWTRHFNSDPAILGRTLQLNGHAFTVVGIAPDGFRGTSVVVSDLWLPMTFASTLNPNGNTLLTSRESTWLMMGGRLQLHVSTAQASSELDNIGRALEGEYPENRASSLRAVPASLIPGDLLPVRSFLAMLMVIVSLVLVIACANVAGVLLARAAARRREIAVRLAIGAGRGRIIRQLLTETILLFGAGGAAGLVLARAMTSLLVMVLPILPVPIDVSLSLDGRVVAFTTGLSLVAALLSGLVPALQTSKADIVSALKDEEPVRRGWFHLRDAFVIGQVAFSVVLVVGAGLFLQALRRGTTIDLGFDPHGAELATVDLSPAGYTEATGPQFIRDIVDRLRRLPGVTDASAAAAIPLGNMIRVTGRRGGLSVPGATPPNGERFFDADWNIVEPGYFKTMRIPLISGRDFDATDRNGTQAVALVSEAAARQFWPRQNAVGQYMRLERAGFPGKLDAVTPLLVVGIVRDSKHRSLRDEVPRAVVFVPMSQQYSAQATLIVRKTRGQRMTGDIRSLLVSMNPAITVDTAQTLDDVAAVALVPQRVAAAVSASLGIVGMLLAAIGVYGVTAFAVTRRTREIGIRIALGAQRSTVVGMVLGQGMSLVGIGAGIGVPLAAAAGQLLGTLLFGVPPVDPITFVGAVLLFAAVGLMACYVPARRATRIDAMVALRSE